MSRRRRRTERRGSRFRTAFDVGLGLALLAVVVGLFVAGWTARTTFTAAVAAFLVGAALWLLRPLFRWVLDLASSGVVAAASPPPARRQAETPRKSKTSASGRVFGLSPREFEVLCADICRRWGYNTRLGRGTADGGVDIELWRGDVYGIAQCKLYQGTVPIAMVRDFYGTMMHRGAKIGFIFTTGRFPVSAEEFVRGKEIRLVDGVYLRAILLEQRQRDWLTKLSSRIVRS